MFSAFCVLLKKFWGILTFPSLSQNNGCSRKSKVAKEERVGGWVRWYLSSFLHIFEATATSSTRSFVLNQALPCSTLPLPVVISPSNGNAVVPSELY